MQNQSLFDRLLYWLRTSVTIRFFTTAFLILLLLIPQSMINSLIHEREFRWEEAVNEVSSKWGKAQTLTGPILTIPYKVVATGKIEYAHFLPEELNILGEIFPESRYRGMYDVVVYNSKLEIKGKFSSPGLKDWNISPENILWEHAFVSTGITDMRGIQDNINLNWDGKQQQFNPGVESKDIIESGVSVPVNVATPDTPGKTYAFSFTLNINGSKSINFMPLGKATKVELRSGWASPSFDGAFLPDERSITDQGFIASWKVLHLNRKYPQQWRGNTFDIEDSSFGVQLFKPADEYQMTMRSSKYAVLIISLTFLGFFLVELMYRQNIHPVQYILVGLALCLFYTLLLSLSEHFSFKVAYLVSSTAIICLIAAYFRSIFKNNLVTLAMTAILAILYGFMYILLQSEDYALLMGSIGLFIVLALVMFLSRKIDWYSFGILKENQKE